MKKYVKCFVWVYITFTMFTESIYFHAAENKDRRTGKSGTRTILMTMCACKGKIIYFTARNVEA